MDGINNTEINGAEINGAGTGAGTDREFEAVSLAAGRFGVAIARHTVDAASLTPTHFGVAIARHTVDAASLVTGYLPGGHTITNHNTGAAQALVTAFIPEPSLNYTVQAAHLRSRPISVPSMQLGATVAQASSLYAGWFGVPSRSRSGGAPRSLFPVRFGVPTLDRGGAC